MNVQDEGLLPGRHVVHVDAGLRRKACKLGFEQAPIVPVTQDQLDAAQRDLNEALARERANQRAIKPGTGTPQTGGNGYNPGAYVPDPQPPQVGESPSEIVAGFLEAMKATLDDT